MARPRVFISHSSKEPSGEEFRKVLAQRLWGVGYRVLEVGAARGARGARASLVAKQTAVFGPRSLTGCLSRIPSGADNSGFC